MRPKIPLPTPMAITMVNSCICIEKLLLPKKLLPSDIAIKHLSQKRELIYKC
jgi:hypothetical protein